MTIGAHLRHASARLAQSRAQLAQAEADQGRTQLDVARYKPLAEQKAVTDQELDNAVQANAAAIAKIEGRELRIEDRGPRRIFDPRSSNRKIMISSFFIRRPIVAMVIAIVTVIAGVLAMRGLPLAQFPEIVPPQIYVSTTYTGADALTIEQSVSTPLEQQMNGVDGMLYMQSINANDGTGQLLVTFGVETDPDIAQVNVQNRVSQAQPNLPTDVNQYGLTTRKPTGLPMLVFALYSPTHSYDSLFLANYANINLNDVLYRVPGVGEVLVFGASEYAMRIWVKPDALAKLGLAVPDLANAIIGVAKAAYFPRISLTGLLGFESNQLSGLFTGPARMWQFIPQVTQWRFSIQRARFAKRRFDRSAKVIMFERE